MPITDDSYDRISRMIDDFAGLDHLARTNLLDELRFMRDHVRSVQRKNEEFKSQYFNRYATLEVSVKSLEKDVAELTAENIHLGEQNLLLKAQVNRLTMQVRPTMAHVEPAPRQ